MGCEKDVSSHLGINDCDISIFYNLLTIIVIKNLNYSLC